MRVKIDTREKFHAITIQEPAIAANMTADMDKCLLPVLQNGVKNVVLILKDIQTMDKAAAQKMVNLQDAFAQNNASFVVCELTEQVKKQLSDHGMLSLLNLVPTENEAFDMVQMEEIERELLGG
jgi:anti-anti-sigma factor